MERPIRDDGGKGVCDCAAEALDKLSGGTPELLLQILLEDIPVQGSPLAFQAAKALKDMGNSNTATLDLIKVLDSCYSEKRSDNTYHRSLRCRTVRVLGIVGGTAAVPVLQKALLDPRSLAVFDATLRALENIGSETVISGLIEALEYYEKQEVRPGCVDRCQILREVLERLGLHSEQNNDRYLISFNILHKLKPRYAGFAFE